MDDPTQKLRFEFAQLPIETRLRRTCRRCGQVLVTDQAAMVALVTGPANCAVQCPFCCWSGYK